MEFESKYLNIKLEKKETTIDRLISGKELSKKELYDLILELNNSTKIDKQLK